MCSHCVQDRQKVVGKSHPKQMLGVRLNAKHSSASRGKEPLTVCPAPPSEPTWWRQVRADVAPRQGFMELVRHTIRTPDAHSGARPLQRRSPRDPVCGCQCLHALVNFRWHGFDGQAKIWPSGCVRCVRQHWLAKSCLAKMRGGDKCPECLRGWHALRRSNQESALAFMEMSIFWKHSLPHVMTG